MPIEAVKIPQNVYVEDRIVGPLTLRQVMIVAIGGGGSYALWSSLIKAYGSLSIITTGIAWTPAVISLAFAFVKVNDLTLTHLLLLMAEKMQKPPLRAMGPRTGITITVRTFKTEQAKKSELQTPALMQAKQNRLAELSTVLDEKMTDQSDDHELDGNPGEDAPPPRDETPIRPPVDPARVTVSAPEPQAPGVDGIRARSSIFSTHA